MRTSDAGVAFLVALEGVELEPYRDAAGKPSVGVGHLIRPGEHFTKLTTQQAYAMLRADLAAAEAVINRAVEVPLVQNQFDALVSFAYNVGPGKPGYRDGFQWRRDGRPSSLLTLLNAGNYVGAAQQFDRWVYADGKPCKGLIRRRASEKALFLSSNYQPPEETKP